MSDTHPKMRRCPCCNGEPVLSRRLTENFLPRTITRSELWRVGCFNCNVRTNWSDSLEFIVSEWNRVPPPSPAEHQASQASA